MYKTHNWNEYNQAIELRDKFGYGAKKIALILSNKGLNVSPRAIEGWIYRNRKPFENLLTKIPKKSRKLTDIKAYILGVLCGDGYISTNYRLGLDVCDLDFIQEFNKGLKKIYGLSLKIKLKNRETNFGKGKPIYCGMLVSKNVCLDLLNYTSFKTKEWEVPKEILENKNLKIKSNFIRGLFDSEGTIRLRRKGFACLQVCSGNIKPLLVIKEILEKDFDICMHTAFRKNLLVLHAYSYKDIKNFSDKIGFVIGRKKNLLKYALSTYKRKGLRHYDKEFKLKVFSLLDQGFSASKIGKLLNFNRTNVYDFIKQREKIENRNL
ncbi:MAG: LAGLIDADG family homing endonuclease [Candidatus Nanoarchaeia archaeon]|nr:LAGLIDADG family homing endonuclease [Candidatus Nanoarchaeia archaeon]